VFLVTMFSIPVLVSSQNDGAISANDKLIYYFGAIGLIASIYFYGLYFIGYRGLDAGYDTLNYITAFQNINGIFGAREIGEKFYGNTELFYWPLQAIFKYFIKEPRCWLILNYTIVFLLSLVVTRIFVNNKKIPFIIFIYIFLTYDLVYYGNIMRQSISFPLGLLSIYYLVNKRYLAYLLLLTLAVSLHWSSIIFVFAPFFLIIRNLNRLELTIIYGLVALVSTWVLDLGYLFVRWLGADEIAARFELYFTRQQEFIGNLYSHYNFWYCLILSILVIITNKHYKQFKALYVTHNLLIFFILAGISTPIFSERLYPIYIFISPMIIYIYFFDILKLSKLRTESYIKVFMFNAFFLILGALVLSSRSAHITLGY